MTDRQRATLDRIVDGETAVLLLVVDGEPVDELAVPVTDLPVAGRREGARYAVERDGDVLLGVDYLPEETESRQREAQERFDRLSRRLGDE